MPASPTLFWYDYETFGRNPARDRIAQFAGIRTDEHFNIIGEPLQLYCKPANDFLPEPEACLLTGITPQIALERGVCEAQLMQQIHDQMARPNTCTLGYNSLRFDDEFTRYSLYRNFFDPYAREWKNGNSRWDIIDMARLCYALRPDGIQWPVHDDGTPSFKLEDLTVANGIEHQGAHDAMADVYATINLARLIKQKQPRLYDYLYSHKHKSKIAEQLDILSRPALVHTSRMYPAQWGCTTLIVPLAQDPSNKNGVIVYDLRSDPEPLLNLDAERVRERVFTPTAELPDGVGRVPLKTVHINKCPVIAPLNTLRPDDAQHIELDIEQCLQHLARIHRFGDTLSSKLQAVFSKPAFPPSDDPDQMLYGGDFFSDADKRVMDDLRRQTPQALSQFKPVFQDPRLPEMLFRYRARNYPHTLDAQEKKRWEAFRTRRLSAADGGGGVNYADYQARLQALAEDAGLSPARRQIVQQLREYAELIVSAS